MATPDKLTEDHWIRRWLARWDMPRNLTVSAGDDCAVLPAPAADHDLVLKTDAIVQDVHFTVSAPPQRIGQKAVNRVLSDFAAMGATPLTLMVSVGLPKKLNPAFVEKCYAGMSRAAARFNVTLAGGETTRSRELWFTVSGIGKIRKGTALLRSTAAAGDFIFVTGALGGAPRTSRHLNFTPRLAEGQWLAAHHLASAMMDLSDGLGKDLPRLAAASRLGFTISAAALPVTRGRTRHAAVNDGEDFELLFTVRPEKLSALTLTWPFKTKFTPIGVMVSGKKNDTDGLTFSGFDHLRTRSTSPLAG
ncbi:MAG: thiamine-phosphate kinase [Verrucomicrobiales bacterium]|jgi:thiamine-monophosphate kinase|nr:thiamine-phosphate kinase [Verrucomicrobiales bacterium]